MTKLLGLALGIGVFLSAAPAFANPPGETFPVDDEAGAADDAGAAPSEYYGGEYVDRAEQRHRMRAIRERIKARFDADGDGRLSREERRAARQAIGPHLQKRKAKQKLRMVKKVIRRFDRDGDGVVGPGEAPAHVVRKLQKLDRNGDGWVDDNDFGRRGRGRGVR